MPYVSPPPATAPWTAPNQQQQPVHSWQTYLLPVLGKAELFNSIDYSAPYDAPANRHVFSAVIDEFLNPVEAGAHSINEFGASHYAGNVHVLGTRQPMSLDKVTDGAGQTILLGEVGAGFRPWGDPRNVRDPAAGIGVSAEQFGRSSREGVQFLMIDGSVRFFSSDTDPSVLKALATPAGNERLPGSTY